MNVTAATFVACVTRKEDIPKDDLPIIALVGRSNVGKSALINSLAGRRELARTSSTPGKTLTINFYLFNEAFYLVDLPGYGYAKASKVTRQRIQTMMNEFFAECGRLKGIIQILDIRRAPSVLDRQMFDWIRDEKFVYMSILTKSDKISKQELLRQQKKIANEMKITHSLTYSSKSRDGRDDLLQALKSLLSGETFSFSGPEAKGVGKKPRRAVKPDKKNKRQHGNRPSGDRKSSQSEESPNAAAKTPSANAPGAANTQNKKDPEGEKKQNRRRRRPKKRPAKETNTIPTKPGGSS